MVATTRVAISMGCCICSIVKGVLAIVGAWFLLRKHVGNVLSSVFYGSGEALPKRFGKWAVITGSTDGIGLAVSHQLAKEGMNLLLVSRSEERLKQASESLQKHNVTVETFAFDFSTKGWKDEKFEQLKTKITHLGQGLGMLFNNVGRSYDHPMGFEKLTPETIDDLWSINVRSALLLTHAALPVMQANRRGALIFTGSAVSVLPASPMLSVYAGCKGAIAAFAESLRVECCRSGIFVQCHTPLIVVSKMSGIKQASFMARGADAYAEDAVAAIKRGHTSLWGSACLIPSWQHQIQMCVSWIMPSVLYNRFIRRHVEDVERRALAKKARQ